MVNFHRNITLELQLEKILEANEGKWMTYKQLLVAAKTAKMQLDIEDLEFYIDQIVTSYNYHPMVTVVTDRRKRIMWSNYYETVKD